VGLWIFSGTTKSITFPSVFEPKHWPRTKEFQTTMFRALTFHQSNMDIPEKGLMLKTSTSKYLDSHTGDGLEQ